MRTINHGWFILLLGLVVSLGACSSDAGSGGGGSGGAGMRDSTRLDGDPTAAASSVISNLFVPEDIDPAEYSTDDFGREVRRTAVEVGFYSETTVAEVNAFLADFSAEIIAALNNFPSLVIRFPDPGSLQDLEALIAEMKSRDIVVSVIPSIKAVTRRLPPDVEQLVHENNDPLKAPHWRYVRHHLAVRLGAAWQLNGLASEPTVMVADYFGADSPTADIWKPSNDPFAISPIPGVGLGFGTRDYDDHGYGMLSILLADHSGIPDKRDDLTELDLVTGVLPYGARLAVADYTTGDRRGVDNQLLATVEQVMERVDGTIVVNMSYGDLCSDPFEFSCQTREDLEDRVVDFIRKVKDKDIDKRVLFVNAAGNRDTIGDLPVGPYDAETASNYAAATLLSGWQDPETGKPLSLDNILVVENARRTKDNAPGFGPKCVHNTSYVGGHIAGLGIDVYMALSPDPILTPPEENVAAKNVSNGGTSAATAQVSGIAAFLASIDDSLSPQQIINILKNTGQYVDATDEDCASGEYASSVRVVDAYSATLALDKTGSFDSSNAKVRMALLDITNEEQQDNTTDDEFNYYDLAKWVQKLTQPLPDEENYFGRYDINGDGTTGGSGTHTFDLDISARRDDAELAFNPVSFEYLGDQVTYFESLITDAEIICYYANSPLYKVVEGMPPFTAEDRDRELEKLRTYCDPCATAGASLNPNGFASKQLPEFCEGVVVTVSPDSVILAPGETQQFTATVTGSENTDVTWTAAGGTIDTGGLYTAGTASGDYLISATSDADESASDSATVTVFYVDGGYSGLGDEFADSGGTREATNVPFSMSVEQVGKEITVRQFLGGPLDSSWVFNGSIDGTRIQARSTVENCRRTNSNDAPCEFEATAKRVDTSTGFFYAMAGRITYDGSESGDDWFVFETGGFSD